MAKKYKKFGINLIHACHVYRNIATSPEKCTKYLLWKYKNLPPSKISFWKKVSNHSFFDTWVKMKDIKETKDLRCNLIAIKSFFSPFANTPWGISWKKNHLDPTNLILVIRVLGTHYYFNFFHLMSTCPSTVKNTGFISIFHVNSCGRKMISQCLLWKLIYM